ncbi:peptidylprolyl isomerase [Oceaniferula marina]|nr:peptidylprolyl isomerase [Oceaniferula marina]
MSVWSLLILYLLCDMFLFNGPVRKKIDELNVTDEERIQMAIDKGICAKVYEHYIYLSQVDRRVQENLFRTGRSPEKVRAKEWTLLRWAALNDLIDEQLLRTKTKVNNEQVSISEQAIDAEVQRFEKLFPDKKAMHEAMAAQGIESEKELRFRLAARLEQEAYLHNRIKKSLTISDEESKQWYDQHKQTFEMPERRQLRHIFLATLDRPSEDAEATLKTQLAKIQAKEADFASAAAEISEDERSKNKGGQLGWMSKNRLPGDFASATFTLAKNQPTLIRTKLGWHIVEVTDIKAPATVPFDTVKSEINSAIADTRRSEAIRQYRHNLRQLSQDHFQIFGQVVNQPVPDATGESNE